MRSGLYPKLALGGIRKNRQLYYPYILTCVGMVFMFFIIASLAASPIVAEINGARTTQILLDLGKNIVAVFAVIFLFYTNSFLMRRRQKEFGLYNILGMSKKNIARILIWETFFTAVIALVGGILSGVVLYKLAELALVRIMKGEVEYTIQIVWNVIPKTILIFGGVFLLLFVCGLLRVRLTNPIELLHSENVGEKPPKANWILGLAGAVILGIGYYLAVTIDDPIAVLFGFFMAVLLVIAGTYLIFIAGSVALCRLLQKSKTYYYKPNHFISVSSMVYRMKRNGAGLASICILATSVLVIMSAGISLIVGIQDVFQMRYPTDFRVAVGCHYSLSEEQRQSLMDFATENLTVKNESAEEYIYALGILEDDSLRFIGFDEENNPMSAFWNVYIIDLETYNRLSGDSATLSDGEILLAFSKDADELTNLDVETTGSFTVKEMAEFQTLNSGSMVSVYQSVQIVAQSLDVFAPLMETAGSGEAYLTAYDMWSYAFDAEESAEYQIENYEEKYDRFMDEVYTVVGDGGWTSGYDSLASSSRDYYALFGGIFFLGLFLSILFVLATVLIIYYKQISEGYEDASRFEIMQKVGMTKKDIRRSINSQMLTVFLLPVGMAGLHMVFAFFIVRQFLLLCGLDNTPLFVASNCGCFVVFAVIYAVVYRITSNAYYRLVSAGAAGR